LGSSGVLEVVELDMALPLALVGLGCRIGEQDEEEDAEEGGTKRRVTGIGQRR
jgi:hypothetical protein